MNIFIVIHEQFMSEDGDEIIGAFKTRDSAVRAVHIEIDKRKGETSFTHDGYDRWENDYRPHEQYRITEWELEE